MDVHTLTDQRPRWCGCGFAVRFLWYGPLFGGKSVRAACSTGRDRCSLSGAQRRQLGCFSEVCNALAEWYFQSVIFFCPLYGGCPLIGGFVMRGSTVVVTHRP